MEIGKIKWAGHYNSQTGDFNNYGFITRLVNYEDLYFRKEGVRTGSRLLTMFNDSDDKYVVFDVVPSPRKASQLQADKVCFLEEIKPEEVVKNLSAESLASQEVQRILLEKCPDALLGDDPIAYFPLMHSAKVRKAFADRYDSGRFKQNVISALSIYFKQTKTPSWDKHNWKLINWKNESVGEIRKLCKVAVDSGIDVTPLLIELPTIWRDDQAFFKTLPANTIQSLLTNSDFKLCKEDFEYIFANATDNSIRTSVCSIAPTEWIVATPESISYLPEEKLAALLNQINWDSTDHQYINATASFLRNVQRIADETTIRAISTSVEKAWIIEDSPWWPLLSDDVKAVVLRDYRNAGLITESNATINPQLDSFLAEYYQGDQQRNFSVQQKEAIQAVKGVTLLFAVPGSGKTTVIVARAGFMAHAMHIAPNSHLIMTFNKAAADEMKERYKAIFSDDGENIPDFRTIHSFCFSVIASLRKKGESFPLLLKDPEDEKDPQKKQKRDREIAAAICHINNNHSELSDLLAYINDRRQNRISAEQAKSITWYQGLSLEDAWTAWQKKDVTQKAILRDVMHKEAYDEDANTLIDTICTLIGFIKNRMLSAEEIKKITYKVEKQDYPIEPIYNAYQQYLQRENLMDFDDMLYRAYSGLKKYPDILASYQEQYPYVSLDEAQDTSLLQHEIVALLVKKHGNLFMVGDDDQSIYAFRGAVPSEMLDFQKRYHQGRKLLMGTNYRSDIDIVRSADRFVQANQKRENKLMRPCSKMSGSIQLVLVPNLSAQYEYITNAALQCLQSNNKKEDLAVLFRWNISALPVMAYFYQNRIPFWCSKQKEAIDSVLTKQEVKRIINLLKYSQGLSNISAFKAAWFVCYRNIINKENLKEIEQIWQRNRNKPVADAVVQFLNTHNLSSKIAEFNNAHQKVLCISASAPRAAISYMMKQSEYGILGQDGDDSISTWMRVYAILSAAEACPNIDSFLRMIEDMQNPRGTNWHESSRKIRLSAMHSAKGAEFSRVIIIDTLDDITPGPETGNDVWYDPEEERRLFYVAVTRAKHELDILQVDIYHDRHQKPSRFIGDLHAANPNVEVVSYSDSKKRSMIRFNMPHFVIRNGCFAGIYSNEDEINEIRKKTVNVQVARLESYADAIVYMHKGDIKLRKDNLFVPPDLANELTESIWKLFGVNSIDQMSPEKLAQIKEKTELFMETSLTDYSHCAKEYALMYLPVNIFKVWKPFMEMLPSGRLPVDGTVKILEIGAGPGTSTLGVLQFYHELSRLNPQRQFSIDYYVIEREPAFISVFNSLVKPIRSNNFAVNIHAPICGDATDVIKQFAGAEMDLILESNMINPNEHILENQLVNFVGDICKALRNYGSLLLLEPEGPEMMVYLRSIIKHANKTDSLLHESMTCEHASVDLTRMRIVQDVIRKGLRVKAIEAHGYSYALLERKDVEVRTK